MQQANVHTARDPETTPGPIPRGRRFERRRDVVDERRRSALERRAEARRRALVSAWLRQLANGG